MKQLLSFNQTIRVRLLLKFFTVITQTMVMPYTVVYFSEKIGPSLTTTMIFIIGIISILGYLIGGRTTDRIGRKKVIIISEIITGIGFVVVSFFDSLKHFHSIPILLSFSFIYFFESTANPAYSALIIDASNESNRKIIYTYFMWISSVAFAIGSLLGGFLFEDYSVWLFFIVGITSFISAIFTYILIKENRLSQTSKIVQTIEENKTNIKKEKFNLLSIFTFQLFLFLCIGQLLLNILKEQFPNYLSIRIVSKYPLENINISRYKIIGYLNLEDTIIVTLAAGLIIKLTKKLSEKTTLIMGLLLFILGYIFLSYFIHPVLLMLGMLFISVGGLIYLPTLQAITAKSIPEQTRGTHLSILGLIGALGGMLSSLFIWGMKYIPEIGVTYIFICIGIFIIYIYINVYKYAHNGNIEKHTDNKTYNYSKGN
ncbi:MFS transporter [Heyndrickxia sp. FSL W8-0423]|uniref:MFS transporter n=1 Tax=Heyndrickxia sp. FSL W8-0423 TaxID=2921601 RepID=UPI0030FBD302